MMQGLVDIVIAVVSGLILLGIGAICLRFDMRPKIEMKYISGANQSSQGGPGKLKCEWHGVLRLYNPTPHTAYNLQVHVPSDANLPDVMIDPAHLAAGESKDVNFDVVREFNRSKVFPHENDPPRPDFNPPHVDPLRDLYPPELSQFALYARYSNGHWLWMYSRFSRRGNQQECTHHRFKPEA